jgi:hypothetical protein
MVQECNQCCDNTDLDYYICNWDVFDSMQMIETSSTLWHSIETTQNACLIINSDIYM